MYKLINCYRLQQPLTSLKNIAVLLRPTFSCMSTNFRSLLSDLEGGSVSLNLIMNVFPDTFSRV